MFDMLKMLATMSPREIEKMVEFQNKIIKECAVEAFVAILVYIGFLGFCATITSNPLISIFFAVVALSAYWRELIEKYKNKK